MSNLVVGVLSLQGAIEDHESMLKKAAQELNIELDLKRVILPDEISSVDGLIIPGGESTSMILIGSKNGMLNAVRTKLKEGLPVFGTCAGAILLSKIVRQTKDSDAREGAFPVLDIEVYRNGYGRQRESFSTKLKIKGIQDDFSGIFIRAPVFASPGDDVQILSEVEGDPVFIKQGNILATTFHPELSNDSRIHQEFLKIIKGNKS